jgi:stage III sporulation protein AD
MVKIVGFAIVAALIIVYLRSINSELFSFAIIAAGIIIIIFAFEYLVLTFNFFNKLIDLTGIDKEFYKIIFKITGIGYMVEFAAETINDFGVKGLSEKLVFAGKVVIFSLSLPILYAVINVLSGILQ